jgi:hypothetical protein
MNAFDIGVAMGMVKAAAGNPAAPQKSSLPGMAFGAPGTAYLNQGGGQATQQSAGRVQMHAQPWPGHVNVGDKKPGTQVPGDVGGRSGSPDTGELGLGQGGDMTVTKSAAFEAGIVSALDD